MVWIIKLTFAIILTSITGSIVLLMWYFIGKGLERLVSASVLGTPEKISGENEMQRGGGTGILFGL